MPDGDRGALRRLKQDFEYYAPLALKVRPKAGGNPVPLWLNRAQKHLHQRLQWQLANKGMVRALILKGRQQGASTYIEGRFFHRVSMGFGLKAYILTHEQKATDNLFGMADTYYHNLPAELRPHLGAANANELIFDRLGSGYSVATAGSKDTGRSATAQLFHGSEVAFWKSADQHMMGVGQIVPNEPGTEIVLETTANGVGNLFHQMWQTAEAGGSLYLPIFTPWFWSDEYQTTAPEGFAFSAEDVEYGKAYGLTPAQLYWRRSKINTDFSGSEIRFQQEYPATAAEAFVNVGHLPFIAVEHVLRARKAEVGGVGARVLGVDPARNGPDRSALVYRQGRKVYRATAYSGINTMQLTGIVARSIQAGEVDKVFVDVIGIGAGVVDRLHELGYTEIVVPVASSERPLEPERYINKRAEMWDLMRAWFEDGPVQVPDSDELQADVVGPQADYQSNGQRLKIESKDDMEKRDVRSPDLGDALALTFAYPVADVFDRSNPEAVGYAPRRIVRKQRDWRAR